MTEERKNKIQSVLEKRRSNITIILENIFNPHNIAAVLRTCDAIGIQDIYILNTMLPPYKFVGKKTSTNAEKWLTLHSFENTEKCIEVVRSKYSKILTTHLTGNAKSVYEIDLTESIAIVFGNEGTGVSAEIEKLADGNMYIPQVGMVQSLNISVACAIVLYEAFRQKSSKNEYDKTNLPKNQYDELFQKWHFYNKND